MVDRRREAGVTVVELARVAKLGLVSTTWSCKHTCPKRCPFQGVCFPHHGKANFTTSLLDESKKLPPVEFAKREAALIDELRIPIPLRLKVYGDCPDRASAQVVGQAATRFMKRTKQPAWGYTHAWDEVKPEDWGDVSMLASCETAGEVRTAKLLGWPTAMVVEDFEDTRRHITSEGVDVIPCPNQVNKNIKCASCKLCMRGDKLRKLDTTIAFKVHSDRTGKILETVRAKKED